MLLDTGVNVWLLPRSFAHQSSKSARESSGADLAETVGFGEVFDTDYRHGGNTLNTKDTKVKGREKG